MTEKQSIGCGRRTSSTCRTHFDTILLSSHSFSLAVFVKKDDDVNCGNMLFIRDYLDFQYKNPKCVIRTITLLNDKKEHKMLIYMNFSY